jgi:hypothetical protein
VEEPKEKLKMKKVRWRGKNQGNDKRTSSVERLT